MLNALRDNAGILIVFLFVTTALLAAGIFLLFRQLSLLRKNIAILKRGASGESLVEKVANEALEIEELSRRLDEQAAQKDYLADVLAGSVQRVAVIRYDAFDDMGGKLSFSIALLDENGDGVVLTSIYGRNENRTYAKAVRGGASSHVLSNEETEALRRAVGTKPPMIRAKGRPIRPFDVQAQGKNDGSFREEDGSWVM
jgi:hypothetical protein